jgi:hypothetical protein
MPNAQRMRKELTDKEREFYFDFLKIQVQLITSRNQFLLVFQSMLLASLGVLYGRSAFFPIWLIIVIGLIVSLAWLYVNMVSHTNEKYLEDTLTAHDERFAAVVHARKNHPFLTAGDSSEVITFLFPSLMIMMWTIILAYYLGWL